MKIRQLILIFEYDTIPFFVKFCPHPLSQVLQFSFWVEIYVKNEFQRPSEQNDIHGISVKFSPIPFPRCHNFYFKMKPRSKTSSVNFKIYNMKPILLCQIPPPTTPFHEYHNCYCRVKSKSKMSSAIFKIYEKILILFAVKFLPSPSFLGVPQF